MTRIFTYRAVRISLVTLFSFTSFFAVSQTSDAFGTYQIWPMNYQLFPRNASNKATIRVKGTLNATLSEPRIRFYRNGTNVKTVVLTPNGSFDESYEITAELANYHVRLEDNFAWKKSAEYLVAGDAYLIQGQSNAEARKMPNDLSNPDSHGDAGTNRDFVRVYGGGADSYSKTWDKANGNNDAFSTYNTGQFGLRLGSEIVRNKGIPVCIINGAERGFHLEQFLKNYVEPGVTFNNYWRTLNRITEAGLAGAIKAVIWFQGEHNVLDHINTQGVVDAVKLTKEQYKQKFNQLYNSWDQDFGLADRFYIIQIRQGCNNGELEQDVLAIQEAQRELDADNPRMDIVSTNNIPRYSDNCHYYYTDGYRFIGDRVYALIDRDFYNGQSTPGLFSPKPSSRPQDAPKFTKFDPQGNPTQLTVYFQHPEASLSIVGSTSELIKKFTLKGGTFTINGVQVENIGSVAEPNNVMRINFSMPQNSIVKPSGLSYYSDRVTLDPSASVRNANNIALVNFDIDNSGPFSSLPVDPMSLRISSNGGNNTLVWELENNQEYELFEIERGESSNKFKTVNEVAANGVSGKGRYQFVDHKPNSVKNFYRIKATKTNGNILYSQVVAVNNNASTRPGISVYPNPAKDQANVSLTVKQAGNATIQVFDGSGKMVSTRKLALLKGNNMFSVGEVLDHGPGIYLIRVVTEEEVFNARLVKVR